MGGQHNQISAPRTRFVSQTVGGMTVRHHRLTTEATLPKTFGDLVDVPLRLLNGALIALASVDAHERVR
jgi:hypothetical protein